MAGDGGEEVESVSRRLPSVMRAVFVCTTGHSPQVETAHLIAGSLIRPGDVYTPVGDDCMPATYDAIVV
jgi:hypothetical protein